MFVKLLFLFMVYAIVGWLWETPYVSIGKKKFINRGFLRGPYIPIYGLACITIILTMSVFDGLNQDSIWIVIIQIVYIGLISAVWEYLTSWSLEVVFKTRWWDYSKHKFNLNGRIALDYSILFGIGGYILWRFINPMFLTLYNSIPNIGLIIIISLFYILFFVDSYATLKDLFNLRSIIIKLDQLKEELAVKQDIFLDRLEQRKVASMDHISELVSSLQELKDKGKGKISYSVETRITNLQNTFRNTKNISRLFKKFPRAPFHYWDDLREKLSRKN